MREWLSKEERLAHKDMSDGSSVKTEAMDHWENLGLKEIRNFMVKGKDFGIKNIVKKIVGK